VKHFYLFGTYYLPVAAVEDGRNAQYLSWREAGLLVETPGEVIDFATIEEDLLVDAKPFGPVEVAFDPWMCGQGRSLISVVGGCSVDEEARGAEQ